MKLKKKENTTIEENVAEEKVVPKYKDIRDVMDRTKEFSMMYSGVESEAYFNGCYNMGVRDFLMSYQYVSNRNITEKYEGMGISLFIDSGAFTYMSDPKFKEYTEEQWEKQIHAYLKWARKHRDMIFAIANLDLDYLVGSKKVQEWNEKYFEPFMLETGIPVCFVYHETEDILPWDKFCQRYPYVGVSFATSDVELNKGKELLRVAGKYNTLVHGMGMTKTSILPQLPFYTVDSTSWKSGFRYGQLAIWNGKKVQMFKKEDWETKALKYTRNYDIDPPLDEELMYNFDEPEILRANVYAYLKAEEYIRQRLKPLMYWFRPTSNNRSEEELSTIEYPDLEWIRSAFDKENNWEEYAKSFNISTEDKTTSINCIIDLTIFMNWENEDYKPFIDEFYNSELIKELHDTWINRIVPNDETRIEDLKKFFTEVLLGKNDKLLVLGTNFDRVVKERENYITDEEYETVDVSEMDINNVMTKYLPAPVEGSHAPEISDLDDEIFREEGIEPVRDEKGRFIKGQKQVLRPKKLYSNKYPKMACDSCFNAQKCPEYKPGYACAYNKMFERYNTRDMGDIIQAMQGIVDFSLTRLQRGMLTETMNGGLPDPNVSNMMNQTMGLLTQLQRMYECGSQEVIRQTKIMRADGTQEMTTQVSNPQTGGILAQIFGDMGASKEEKEENVINVEPKE